MAASEVPRRLRPEVRRTQLLRAGRDCLAEGGAHAFTLEEVAQRASVTGPLLRHYFGSRDGLLVAVCRQLLDEVLAILLAGPEAGGLEPRLAAYLRFIAADPWAHGVWMHASEINGELAATVGAARTGLAGFSFDLDWERAAPDERLAALGWVGYVESVVSAWVDSGAADPGEPLAVLLGGARLLGVRDL